VEEVGLPGEGAAAAAERLAVAKAREVARRCRSGRVLAADTIVRVDGLNLGKPTGPDDARRMLRALSGRTHRVVTGVALCGAGGRLRRRSSAVTKVTFRALRKAEIDWYVGTGEPLDKAGAYGIQGRASLFVTAIRGSFTNVVGLPMELIYEMLGLPA